MNGEHDWIDNPNLSFSEVVARAEQLEPASAEEINDDSGRRQEAFVERVREAMADYDANIARERRQYPCAQTAMLSEDAVAAVALALSDTARHAAEGVFYGAVDATGLSAREINVDWKAIAKSAVHGAIKRLTELGYLPGT